MQFFVKLLILLGVVVFNIFNTNVPYFPNKLLILNIKSAGCKAVNNLSADLTVKKKSEELSQESPNDTLKGDNNLFVEQYVDQKQEDLVQNEFETEDLLDLNTDVDLEDTRSQYDSLCFTEFPQVGEPLQLVYPNKDHTELVLDYEVLKVLESIPKPLYPVALIGSVNSGKSFLLNLLNDNYYCNVPSGDKSAMGSPGSRGSRKKTRRYTHDAVNRRFKSEETEDSDPKPFKVSSSPEPETYGIWVYSKPLKLSRLKLQRLMKENSEKTNLNFYSNFYSLKNVSTNKDSNSSSKLSRVSADYEFNHNQLMKNENLDDVVNVVFLDVEGFNSHKNVFKYDEALFSVVSSICSEVVYLSNKTLNTSDLQLIEELIKSSLLSKISNLYTAYNEFGESQDEMEEIFQYFLKMFENKNLTFLVNEFNYSSEKAFENLVNLLKAPKRDLSLHEVYMYHNKMKSASENEEVKREFVKKLKFSGDQKLSSKEKESREEEQRNQKEEKEQEKDNEYDGKKDKEDRENKNNKEGKEYKRETKENKNTKDKEVTREEKRERKKEEEKYVCKNRKMQMEDVMFNSFGYIFHMLFNSVNMAVLPSTSKNPFMSNSYFGMGNLSGNSKTHSTSQSTHNSSRFGNTSSSGNSHFTNSSSSSTYSTGSTSSSSNSSSSDSSGGHLGYTSNNRSSVEEEYVDKLSNFKFGLFTRSTQSPLVKYCVVDGVTSNCYMTGRDLADMVRLTVNTLSLNKFYKLATNLGTVEGTSKIDYKDAFDEYFRVFRSTRLLMIKNDLYETYKTVLKKFVDGDSVKKDREHFRSNKSDNKGVDTYDSSYYSESSSTSDTSYSSNQTDLSGSSSSTGSDSSFDLSSLPSGGMPSVEMLRVYANKLKEQLLRLMVKNFENEAFSEDFNNIKKDLVQGLDRLYYLAEADLSTKIRNYCMSVGESLLREYSQKTSRLNLPVLPSRLKYLHNLPEQFGKKFKTMVDYGYFESEGREESEGLGLDSDPDYSTYSTTSRYSNNSSYSTSSSSSGSSDSSGGHLGYTGNNRSSVEERRNDLLSEDLNCVSVYEEYLGKLEETTSGVLNKNRELIDAHFHSVFNRAMKHYTSRFVDVAHNYEIPLQEALEKSKLYLKEAENVLVTHLGEFHAIETMATSYKSHLRSELTNEEEKFKKNYTKNCLNTLEGITSHYVDRYHELLNKYTSLPTNPVMLYKYHEYMNHLSQTEVLRVVCADPPTQIEANEKLSSKLKKKYTESLVNNANAVGKALSAEFEKMDKYLLEQVPNCRFYHYFSYNAKRYAKFKITSQFIFNQLKLQTTSVDPLDVLGLQELLYNPENAEPVKTPTNTNSNTGVLNSKYSLNSYNLDPKELKNRFLNLKTDKLQKKFVDLVVDYYVKNHIFKFKKMFVNKYYRTIVLVCSVTLLGFSGLSMCLAQNWLIKLAFSLLGFMSYGFLVGLDKFKSNSTTVVNLFKTVLAKGVSGVWHLLGLGLEKLWDLVARLLTMAFMNAGHMQTFKLGLFTAFTIYLALKLLIRKFKSRREAGNRRS